MKDRFCIVVSKAVPKTEEQKQRFSNPECITSDNLIKAFHITVDLHELKLLRNNDLKAYDKLREKAKEHKTGRGHYKVMLNHGGCMSRAKARSLGKKQGYECIGEFYV